MFTIELETRDQKNTEEDDMPAPHRMVDSMASGVINGVERFISSSANAIKGAGDTIVSGLDKPFKDITGKEGPIMILGILGDGFIGAGTNFVDNGIIGSVKIAGETVMKALDQPIEQLGLPTDMGKLDLFKRGR